MDTINIFILNRKITKTKRTYGNLSGALMTTDAGMRLQRGSKWVTVQQGTDYIGTDWLCI